MIRIETSGDRRTYTVPRALVDVALELFSEDEISAVFSLARRLVADDLHTAEQIAINNGHDEAVQFARSRMVERAPAQT